MTFRQGLGILGAVSESDGTFRKQRQSTGNDSKMTEFVKIIGDRLIVLQPDLKTYSAPIRLLEALIGTVADHWRLPAHELHLWRRLACCEKASTKLQELLSKVPLYKTLFTSQIPTDETTTLRIYSRGEYL